MPSYKAQNSVPYTPSNYSSNPYDDFMKKHLSHYGYYTGKNSDYNKKSFLFNDFNKTHGYEMSSSSSEDEQRNDDVNQDPKSRQLEYRFEAGRLVSRLKEPRQLFAITNPSLGPQQLPRWPAELEVAIEKLQHSLISPSVKEPFYVRTGNELQPQLVSKEGGRTVFQLQNHTSPFFLHSRVGGSRDELQQVTEDLNGPDDTTLLFESRFESGNLAKAVQTGPFSYELWLRNDLYTNKHTQWFYFQIKNTRKGQKYRFTICNFMKSSSLYNDGMKPCYYSEKEEQSMGLGWRRKGEDIAYYKSNYTYATGKSLRSYYALTFTETFSENDDTIYLSHCYPYTYSDLQDYLKDIVDDEYKSKLCKLRVLTRSLAGNLVYLLSVTSPSEESQPQATKRAVVVTARVHPGETNGSWMMKGLLDYILGRSKDAKLLRDTFIFKIVPMLNPDGVIVGNYRCSLAGRDLNRNYKSQLTDSYPTIMAAKSMIKKLTAEREVVVYCDLHGHSRKQNVFIYGCENRTDRSKRLHERVFPAMLSKNCPDKFVFEECTFKVQKGKEGTGRIVMWNLGISNSFTMEATFCGSMVGQKKGIHFNMRDFESMGYHFCDTLLDYCDPDKSKYTMIMSELENALKNQILNKFAKLGRTNVMLNGKQVDLSDPDLDIDELLAAGIDLSEDDGGSDSSVSDGPPVNIAYMQNKANAQKKKKLSKKERDKLKNDSLSNQNGSSKTSRPPTSSSFKAGHSRVCSAKERHEKCHHNHSGKDKTCARRCLSARHLHDTPSSGGSDRTTSFRGDLDQPEPLVVNGAGYVYDPTENSVEDSRLEDTEQRAYLASINKGAMTPDMSPPKASAANSLKPITGHLRYSTSNISRPLAMNLDELTEHQPECSVSAQYLLTRVKCTDTPPIGNRENEQAYDWLARGQGDSSDRYYPLSNGITTHKMPKVGSSVNQRSSSASYKTQKDSNNRENRSLVAYSKHQTVRQVDMSSALDGTAIKQHPLPFEKVTKPGQGAVEAGPVSTPHYSKRPERQRTAHKTRQREEKLVANSDELRSHIDSELDDIRELRDSLHNELTETDLALANANGKYLEKMVLETDQDIEKLRKELTELHSENFKHNRNSILDLAARQRHMVSSHKKKQSISPDIKSSSGTFMGVKFHSTGVLNRLGDSQSAPVRNRKVNQEAKVGTQASKELLKVTSNVSVHMSNHPVPSAPKASRRVQVRNVPSSRQKRYH